MPFSTTRAPGGTARAAAALDRPPVPLRPPQMNREQLRDILGDFAPCASFALAEERSHMHDARRFRFSF